MTKLKQLRFFFKLILFVISISSYSQKNINYSQVAFNKFKESILKKSEIIYVQKKLEESDPANIDSACFKNFDPSKKLKIVKKNKSLIDMNEKNVIFTTEYIGLPIVSVSLPYKNKSNQYFVIIDYKYLNSSGILYLFEIDENGTIQEKCELKYIE